MRRFLDAYGPLLGAGAIAVGVALTLAWVGPVPAEEHAAFAELSDPAVRPPAAAGSALPVTVATADPEPVELDRPPGVGPVATVTAPTLVERGVQVAVAPPPTPPTTTVLVTVPGECETWRPLVERYGMPWDWARPIMWRESTCSHAFADRPSTADLSVGAFQINYYAGSMAAWWTDSGWPFELTTTDPEAAVAAAGALYAACGTGPWDRRAGYPCRGDGRLRTPDEMGYRP